MLRRCCRSTSTPHGSYQDRKATTISPQNMIRVPLRTTDGAHQWRTQKLLLKSTCLSSTLCARSLKNLSASDFLGGMQFSYTACGYQNRYFRSLIFKLRARPGRVEGSMVSNLTGSLIGRFGMTAYNRRNLSPGTAVVSTLSAAALHDAKHVQEAYREAGVEIRSVPTVSVSVLAAGEGLYDC